MSDDRDCGCEESQRLRAELARAEAEAQSYARSLLVAQEDRARLRAFAETIRVTFDCVGTDNGDEPQPGDEDFDHHAYDQATSTPGGGPGEGCLHCMAVDALRARVAELGSGGEHRVCGVCGIPETHCVPYDACPGALARAALRARVAEPGSGGEVARLADGTLVSSLKVGTPLVDADGINAWFVMFHDGMLGHCQYGDLHWRPPHAFRLRTAEPPAPAAPVLRALRARRFKALRAEGGADYVGQVVEAADRVELLVRDEDGTMFTIDPTDTSLWEPVPGGEE